MKRFTLGLSFFFAFLSTLALYLFFSKTTLHVDNRAYTRYSIPKGTVQEMLDRYEVKLGTADLVEPPLGNRLRWGEHVKVTRVQEVVDLKKETVDFTLEWKRRTTKNLRRVEIQHGHRETKTFEVRRTLHDGKDVSFRQTLLKVEKKPVDRLVFIDDRGHAEKIYDLSVSSKMVLIATAYWVGDPQVPGTITFSGHPVERGLVAVDPTVLPLGYRLYIPGYGYAYSSDTGSAIIGKRIDLFVESKKASRQWEYKKVTVYILEKAKKW